MGNANLGFLAAAGSRTTLSAPKSIKDNRKWLSRHDALTAVHQSALPKELRGNKTLLCTRATHSSGRCTAGYSCACSSCRQESQQRVAKSTQRTLHARSPFGRGSPLFRKATKKKAKTSSKAKVKVSSKVFPIAILVPSSNPRRLKPTVAVPAQCRMVVWTRRRAAKRCTIIFSTKSANG